MFRALCAFALVAISVGGCDDDTVTHNDDLAVANDFAMPDLSTPYDLARLSWHLQPVPVSTSLYASDGAAGEIFVVGDRGTVLRTNDNGVHWEQQSSGTAAALFGVWTDGATTIAVGYQGTLLRSVDDGATWQTAILGSATLRAVAGNALGGDGGVASELWAVGEGGTVLRSHDSGVTWVGITTPAAGDLRAVWASPSETFVLGDRLVRTRDDGATWTTLAGSPGNLLSGTAVWASGSGQIIYASGASLVRSRDGGLTWASIVVTSPENLSPYVGVAAFINGELWAATAGGSLRHVVADFDNEVVADETQLAAPIEAIWGSDPGNLFIVGDNGLIAHRQ